MKSRQIYTQFLESTKLLEKTTALTLLEQIEKILKIIAVAKNKNQKLSVKDMVDISDICSPTTMHKNIHSLVDKGWIYLENTEDARR